MIGSFDNVSVGDLYDFLRNDMGIGIEALDLAFGLNGFTRETAKNILYWYTGYDDFDSFYHDEIAPYE